MRANSILPLVACTLMAFIAPACDDTTQGVIVDFVVSGTTFDPTSITLTAAPGDTLVRWGFRDGPHNVTFEDGATASGNRSSGVFERSYAAVAPGTNRFRCSIHSSDFTTAGQMNGSVIVQ